MLINSVSYFLPLNWWWITFLSKGVLLRSLSIFVLVLFFLVELAYDRMSVSVFLFLSVLFFEPLNEEALLGYLSGFLFINSVWSLISWF